MHAGNLVEEKGKISLLHEQWGKYEVYIPSENKRIRGDHGIKNYLMFFESRATSQVFGSRYPNTENH